MAVTFPESFLLKCVVYILLNVLFINILTDSFLLFTNILYKMLEFNPLYCKKKPCVKMSFNLFLFKCIIDFFFRVGGFVWKELLYERSRTKVHTSRFCFSLSCYSLLYQECSLNSYRPCSVTSSGQYLTTSQIAANWT